MSHKNVNYTNIIYDVKHRTIQTDNDTEFVNTRDALDNNTFYKKVVRCNGIRRYETIPLVVNTWQSEVETSHWIIEKKSSINLLRVVSCWFSEHMSHKDFYYSPKKCYFFFFF